MNEAQFSASGDSIDYFREKQQNLEKQLEATREKTQALADKLEVAKRIYGENSDEASRLRTQVLNNETAEVKLEKAIADTNDELRKAEEQLESTANETEDLTDETEELSKETKKAGDTAEKSSGGFTIMKGVLSNLITDGIRKAADAFKDFAGDIVEVAAEVKAQDSQFAQTFGDMADNAEDAISRVANATGIADTRLKGTATQIYAFARSSGADVPTAMKMMETSLQAAADSAAYYDTSLEDTAETLQSFLKGNFANDAALGVSATEATRNAEAYKLFGTEFSKLTEIQKQQTLLAMVTDAQALSGAAGQASREMDGWENVTGNLKETWRQFQASVGTPVLENLVPVVQNVTASFRDWINGVDWAAFGEKITGLFQGIRDGFQWISNNVGVLTTIAGVIGTIVAAIGLYNTVQTVSAAVTAAKTAANLAETASLWSLVAAQTAAIAPYVLVVAAIAAVIAIIVLCIKYWDEIKAAVISAWQTIRDWTLQVVGTIRSFIVEKFNAIKSGITTALTAIRDFFVSVWNGIKTAVTVIIVVIYTVISTYINMIKTVVTTVFNAIKNTAVTIWNGIKTAITTVVDGIKTRVSLVFDGIKTAASTAFNAVKTTATTVWNGIKTAIMTPINAARDGVKTAIDKIKGFFNFKVSLPKIKLPHFSIKPAGWKLGDLLEGSIPSLGISWYAEGGIMKRPTVFGMNGNNLMIGGEAGAEAIAPIETLQTYVSSAVEAALSAVRLDDVIEAIDRLAERPNVMSINGREFAVATAADVDTVGGDRLNLRTRGLALT